MRPAYFRQRPAAGRDRWMVSYLDVLTILLILFVAMAAKTLHSEPAQPMQAPRQRLAPPQGQAAPQGQAPPPAAAERLQAELEREHLDVRRDPRGVVVSLPQELLYAPGQDRINAAALPAVRSIADALRKIPNPVILVGHADAQPIRNRRFRNNWDLAAARGLRLLELLSAQYGIAEARLSVESHGSNQPKTANDTPGGRAANRRVEIVILHPAPAL